MTHTRQETIVVWGEEDKILDPKSGQQFVKELPHARCQCFQVAIVQLIYWALSKNLSVDGDAMGPKHISLKKWEKPQDADETYLASEGVVWLYAG